MPIPQSAPPSGPVGAADLAGAMVLVAGARVTGAAVAAALLDRGAVVTVTDSAEHQLRALQEGPVGDRVSCALALDAPPPGTDLVVTSPGFRPDAPLMVAAAAAGVGVIGDVELARWIDLDRPGGPADWVVVTGTNGKTTTVGMLEAILRAAGLDAVACGNVGLPVLDAVLAGHRTLAVELSSFQLHWMRSLTPLASTVLNLSADHLDWHGSFDAYAADKATVYSRTRTAVVNADDPVAAALAGDRDVVAFRTGVPSAGEFGVLDGWLVERTGQGSPIPLAEVVGIRPPGPHNTANALAAAALARAAGVRAGDVAAGLAGFEPGGHRGALVAEHAGVRYLDDSKATNPHAATAALLAGERVVWVAGGLLKGVDTPTLDALVAEVADRLVGVVLMGADRHLLAAALARHAPEVPVRVVDSGDDDAMIEVVARAAELARPGDVVLLAPAAASMDMFTDYAHRGRAFAAAAGDLARRAPSGRRP